MAAPVSDELWSVVEPLIPKLPPSAAGGRPRVPDRQALTGIIFVLRSGIVVRLPFCSRAWCLPVLARLHLPGKNAGPSKVSVAAQLVALLAAAFADRRLHVVADAAISLKELFAYLGADLPKGADESLGKMLTHHLGKIPEAGTAFSKFGLRFIVRTMEDQHVGKVEVIRG